MKQKNKEKERKKEKRKWKIELITVIAVMLAGELNQQSSCRFEKPNVSIRISKVNRILPNKKVRPIGILHPDKPTSMEVCCIVEFNKSLQQCKGMKEMYRTFITHTHTHTERERKQFMQGMRIDELHITS
jgi:hypothetical protein